MANWHVFTKDGNEYKGSILRYEENCMVLFHKDKIKHQIKFTTRKDKMVKKLYEFFGQSVASEWEETIEVYDYIIPCTQILRVELW